MKSEILMLYTAQQSPKNSDPTLDSDLKDCEVGIEEGATSLLLYECLLSVLYLTPEICFLFVSAE